MNKKQIHMWIGIFLIVLGVFNISGVNLAGYIKTAIDALVIASGIVVLSTR